MWQYFHYNVLAIGAWRSLVSRLVRVQEAAGSNPAAPTKNKTILMGGLFYMYMRGSSQVFGIPQFKRFGTGDDICIFPRTK